MQISSFLERISLPVPVGVPGSAVPAILVGLFVALGGVLFGYVQSLSSARGVTDIDVS